MEAVVRLGGAAGRMLSFRASGDRSIMGATLNRLPASVLCAIFAPVVASALITAGAVGCTWREATDTTPAATGWSAVRAASPGFAGPAEPQTPTSTATPDETTPDAAGRAQVGVTRREIEDEVLTWFDPTREPRIEWSRYGSRSSLADAWEVDWWGLLYDQWTEDTRGRTPDELPDLLALVVASTRGSEGLANPRSDAQSMDRLAHNGITWLQGQTGTGAVSPGRVTAFGLFDP